MDTLYFLRQINYNLVNILKSVTFQLGKKVTGLISGNFRFNRLSVSKYHFTTPRGPLWIKTNISEIFKSTRK